MWVKIKQNENYSINENGEVRNDITGKTKKAFLGKNSGYWTIDLWQGNKPKKVTIHRLLAEAFIPNPHNLPTVDHKDGNRQNNSLENLRWASYSDQNSRFRTYGVRSERIKATHYVEQRKKRGGGHEAWLGEDKVLYFDRITDAAVTFGSTVSNISLLLKNGTIGKRGRTRGWLFEYMGGGRSTYHERVTTTETAGSPETE